MITSWSLLLITFHDLYKCKLRDQRIASKAMVYDIESQCISAEKSGSPTTRLDKDNGDIHELHTIRMSGNDKEYVHIGNMVLKRSELVAASGGDLRPTIHLPAPRRFGNAVPLGLMAFGSTTFLVSLTNVHARHVTQPNVALAVAYAFGGFVQLCAGMWEIASENTFGATTLSGMGGWWFSYGILLTPGFGVADAYSSYPGQLDNAQGMFLITWAMFVYMLMICTIRSTVTFFGLFLTAGTTLVLLACFFFTGNVGLQKASGWVGIITSFFAYFNAMVGLVSYESCYVHTEKLKVYMPGALR